MAASHSTARPPMPEGPGKVRRFSCPSLHCEATYGTLGDRNKHMRKLSHPNEVNCIVLGCEVTMQPQYLAGHLAEHQYRQEIAEWEKSQQMQTANLLSTGRFVNPPPVDLQSYNPTQATQGSYATQASMYPYRGAPPLVATGDPNYETGYFYNQQSDSASPPHSTIQQHVLYRMDAHQPASTLRTTRATEPAQTLQSTISNSSSAWQPHGPSHTPVAADPLNSHPPQGVQGSQQAAQNAPNSQPTSYTELLYDDESWDPSQANL